MVNRVGDVVFLRLRFAPRYNAATSDTGLWRKSNVIRSRETSPQEALLTLDRRLPKRCQPSYCQQLNILLNGTHDDCIRRLEIGGFEPIVQFLRIL